MYKFPLRISKYINIELGFLSVNQLKPDCTKEVSWILVPGLEIRPWIPLRVWLVQFPRLRASQVAENPDSSTLESEVKLSHTSLDLLSKVKTLPERFVTF